MEKSRKINPDGIVEDAEGVPEVRAAVQARLDGRDIPPAAIRFFCQPFAWRSEKRVPGLMADSAVLATFGAFADARERMLEMRDAAILDVIQAMNFELDLPYPRSLGDALPFLPLLDDIGRGAVEARASGMPLVVTTGMRRFGDAPRQGACEIDPKSFMTLPERAAKTGGLMIPVSFYALEIVGGARIAVIEATVMDEPRVRFSPMLDDPDQTARILMERLDRDLPASRRSGDSVASNIGARIGAERRISMLQFGEDMAYWLERGKKIVAILVSEGGTVIEFGVDAMESPLHTKEAPLWSLGLEGIRKRLMSPGRADLRLARPGDIVRILDGMAGKIKEML